MQTAILDLRHLNPQLGTIAVLIFGCLLVSVEPCQAQPTRNSTRKIRVKPSPVAAKIGTGVNWVADVKTALERSRETGKPVFWYVPTVSGSFMDRKPVIDRYMLAGPFSWESTRQALNRHFVPVKAVPNREEQDKYDLKPYKFVEPGFLVIDSDQALKLKVDRITTLHPAWFQSLLDSAVEGGIAMIDPDEQTGAIQNQMHAAMKIFRSGEHARATEAWQAIAKEHPNHPLGWKAAAEAEGFGPIVRGFEVQTDIPDAALKAGIESAGSAAPRNTYGEEELIQRSLKFLLGMQRKDGGFVDCDYDFGGTDSLPNVHVAVTALAGMAMFANQDRLPGQKNRVDAAIKRAAEFVVNDDNIAKSDRDEILWAYAYRVRFLSRLVKTYPEFAAELQRCVESLESIKTRRGGWYHEYNNPFVTATALNALSEARNAGAKVNSSKVTEGVASLAGDRFANGAYPYGSSRGPKGDPKPGTARQIAASAGRMPLCELGLWNWKEATDERLTSAITVSFDMHDHLTSALKYDDHTSNMAYGGFFFWYDMRGRSEAISKIEDEQVRAGFESKQKEIILSLPELDGCFVDSHELGRCYGTAMALLSLDLLN